ncbi:hypothetical protein T492DRAFT_908275, partial [Pavlovales sp. CCMP2436]
MALKTKRPNAFCLASASRSASEERSDRAARTTILGQTTSTLANGLMLLVIPKATLRSSSRHSSRPTTGLSTLARRWGLAWGLVLLAMSSTAATGVPLGGAEHFAILARGAISNTPASSITGNVGSASGVDGFQPLTADSSGEFFTSPQIDGRLYRGTDNAEPTPTMLASALADMDTAYTDASSRAHSLPNSQYVDVMAGAIAGVTFVPGVYKWNTFVHLTGDIYVQGGATDVWIFQVQEYVTTSAAVNVVFQGDGISHGTPTSDNLVWVVGKYLVLGATCNMHGTFIVAAYVTFGAASHVAGRILARAAVTLDSNSFG